MTISVAFGDPFDGEVSEGQIASIAAEAARAGIGEIALGDTIGVADPWTVRRRIEAVRKVAPDARIRMHFHNTRNTGFANVYASLEAGAAVIDASTGGIGGCPFAPDATGNIATEDLVYMLQRGGIDTGLDLDKLIQTGRWIGEKLGKPVPSALTRAGVFPPSI
jgi:hydroxymethylglutaryl-CoA lyase